MEILYRFEECEVGGVLSLGVFADCLMRFWAFCMDGKGRLHCLPGTTFNLLQSLLEVLNELFSGPTLKCGVTGIFRV